MAEPRPDPLHAAAPAYADVEARRARAGVAAALFGDSPAPADPERISVGRYEIRSRLGAGGMGVVYRAHDPDLDRSVAVKLLHTDSSTDEKARARMLREARALAKLSHPNVITVFDVGTEDGQVFVAMELVAGRDLRRWLEHHRTADWREVLALLLAAGRGLAAAHEASLIHRDFKPENVLIGDDGRVRVLDFGLARLHRSIDGATDPDADPDHDPDHDPDPEAPTGDITKLPTTLQLGDGLTETGAMLGTPLYMAPELYAGKPADERSDQFAFCASLYEAAYRQLPFGSRVIATHVEAVTAGRIAEPPENSPVPITLWRILARGLAADPEARHPDMPSLLAALDQLAIEPAATEVPSSSSPLRWLVVVALVVLAVAGLVSAELGLFDREPAMVVDASPDPAPAAEPERLPTEPAGDPSPPPDRVHAAPLAGVGVGVGVQPPEPKLASASESETGETEGPETGELGVPEPTDWCHLHEDQFTLLAKTSKRQARFARSGQCYSCRPETRKSRTQSFSPRDCEGYSLCGPAPASECE